MIFCFNCRQFEKYKIPNYLLLTVFFVEKKCNCNDNCPTDKLPAELLSNFLWKWTFFDIFSSTFTEKVTLVLNNNAHTSIETVLRQKILLSVCDVIIVEDCLGRLQMKNNKSNESFGQFHEKYEEMEKC